MDESSAEPLDPQQLRERIEEEEGGSAFILRIEWMNEHRTRDEDE